MNHIGDTSPSSSALQELIQEEQVTMMSKRGIHHEARHSVKGKQEQYILSITLSASTNLTPIFLTGNS
jgi:hypothetical protein